MMMRKATHTFICISAAGVETRERGVPDLETLQRMVGGLIQELPHFRHPDYKRVLAYCDEEGQLKKLPLNRIATDMWRRSFPDYAELWYEPRVYGACVVVVRGDQTVVTEKRS